MDPRLSCQQGPTDDLTNQLGYGSDMSMNQEMWSHGNYEEFYPGEGRKTNDLCPLSVSVNSKYSELSFSTIT